MIKTELKICIFCGARPNFIKVAPIIRKINQQSKDETKRKVSYKMVYVGKPADPTIEDGLFTDLDIKRPDVCLGVTCKNLNELTGQVMSKFETYLQENKTNVVIVVDDLASTMAASIVAKKQGLLLAHIAAGTRSFDITMPKEINRLVIDGLSDILFTAGLSNNSIANKEGAELSKVYMVGNCLIDNIRFNREKMKSMSLDNIEKIKGLELKRNNYLVFTLNRKALINDKSKLESIIETIVTSAGDKTIVAPLRSSAIKAIATLDIAKSNKFKNFKITMPLGYLEFVFLVANSLGIITDSGNVAEEATFNSIPCATINSYTEHIETVKEGSNILVGEDTKELANAIKLMINKKWKESNIPNRWDGRSAERILQILMELG